MSQIAERAGIGRATLYKYFPDVETILLAWHERQITGHLEHLAQVRDQAGEPAARLRAVRGRSRRSRGHGDGALVAFLHRDEQVGHARIFDAVSHTAEG
jgi:AcrR family transcriptional regulator